MATWKFYKLEFNLYVDRTGPVFKIRYENKSSPTKKIWLFHFSDFVFNICTLHCVELVNEHYYRRIGKIIKSILNLYPADMRHSVHMQYSTGNIFSVSP